MPMSPTKTFIVHEGFPVAGKVTLNGVDVRFWAAVNSAWWAGSDGTKLTSSVMGLPRFKVGISLDQPEPSCALTSAMAKDMPMSVAFLTSGIGKLLKVKIVPVAAVAAVGKRRYTFYATLY